METLPEEGGVAGEDTSEGGDCVDLQPHLVFLPVLRDGPLHAARRGQCFDICGCVLHADWPADIFVCVTLIVCDRNERARWVTALGQSTNDRKNMDKTGECSRL